VRAREEVGGSQAGDSGTDDSDAHQPLFVRRRMSVDR
jgi:hypothetical protein